MRGIVRAMTTRGEAGAKKLGRPRKTSANTRSVHLRVPEWVEDGYEQLAKKAQQAVLGGKAITGQDVMRDVLERVLVAYQEGKVSLVPPEVALAQPQAPTAARAPEQPAAGPKRRKA